MSEADRRHADATYFEKLYRTVADPWQYETSSYEQEKYRVTLDALTHGSYASVLEIGCSIGVFTVMLAARCQRLLAVDVAGTAVRRAARRCRHLPHVRVEQRRIPSAFPDGRFDLMVLSETGYYLSDDELRETGRRIVAGLDPGGQLLLVHHTEHIDDATMRGDAVHDLLIAACARDMERSVSRRGGLYRLDLLQRRGR